MDNNDPRRQEIAISALMTGVPVKLSGQTYRLFKKGDTVKLPSFEGVVDEKFWLGYEVSVQSGATSSKAYLGSNVRLTDFLELCDSLTNDECMELCCNTVINKKSAKRTR